MRWFINKLKLRAAAGSMHQFCPLVRAVFPEPPDDEIVEATTTFLYLQMATDIFGQRFTDHLHSALRERFRFATPIEIDSRVDRIRSNVSAFDQASRAIPSAYVTQTPFTRHVQSVIRSLLCEAGSCHDDPELVRTSFPRFEIAARTVKDHLLGIRHQSQFIMKHA